MWPRSATEGRAAAGRRLWPRSLATRLAAWHALAAFGILLPTVWILYAALAKSFDAEVEEFMRNNLEMFAASLRREGAKWELRKEIELGLFSRRYMRIYFRVRSVSGATLIESPGMSPELAAESFPPAPQEAGESRTAILTTPAGKSFRVMTARIALGESGGEPRVVQFACDREHEKDILAACRRVLWAVTILGMAVSLVVGYLLARRGLRPLREVSVAAQQIHSSTLHRRLDAGAYPRELGELARTLNQMLDRLEEAFNRLSQFSADLAHELRGPLNNLRGEMEVALTRPRPAHEYREVLASGLEECEHLSRMVDQLLFLARSEDPRAKFELREMDLAPELRKIVEFYEALAFEREVALELEATGPLPAVSNRELFGSAVGNLVSNAVLYSGPRGRVKVVARRAGGRVEVEVADNGCGIAPEHLPHLFDRFYRVESSRSGTDGGFGLGLTIARRIAELHGGTLELTSQVGVGTRALLSLPAQLEGGGAVAAGDPAPPVAGGPG